MCSCVAISTMTRLRVVCVTGMLTVLGGCPATHPVPDSDTHPPPPERILASAYLEAAPGTGVVSVKRDAGWEACTLQVRVAGRPVALLRAAESVTLHLPPGKHVVSVTEEEGGGGKCGPLAATEAEMQSLQVTVAPEHPVDVRIGFGNTGRVSIHSVTPTY